MYFPILIKHAKKVDVIRWDVVQNSTIKDTDKCEELCRKKTCFEGTRD